MPIIGESMIGVYRLFIWQDCNGFLVISKWV